MQPSAGSQVAPERSYGRWRATVLANRDLLSGLLPTLALFIFAYGLACAQHHGPAGECSVTQYSLHGPDPGSAAEQCGVVTDPAGAALQGAAEGLAARILNATQRLCPPGPDDGEDVHSSSVGRQVLAGVARFMMLQVCTPLLRHHYETICSLVCLYTAVILLLLRKRLYVVWRPVLLGLVRLVPLTAAAWIACSYSHPDLLLRLDECFMFYVKRPGTTHQMAARLTHLDAWQLQQLLLALGICWQAVTLPLPPHVEGPVAATQGLLLVLIVGRISQALGMFGVPSFVAYWAACLLLCYVVPTWFSVQLDRRLRLRYRAWHTSVPSHGSSSEFEEREVLRHPSDTSTTSWWSATSKESGDPWHLPGHEGELGSSSRACGRRRASSSGSSSSSGRRSPSPVRSPPRPLPTARSPLAPLQAAARPPAAVAAAAITSSWPAPRGAAAAAATGAAAGGGGRMGLLAEEEPLPDWTLPQGARSPSLDSAHDINLSSQGVEVPAEQDLRQISFGLGLAPQQPPPTEQHTSSRAARVGAAAAAASPAMIHPSSISLGPLLPTLSSGGASVAVATPSGGMGQGVPAAAQPTQVSSNASTAPSITTVYMQLPGGTAAGAGAAAAAPNPAAAVPSPFTGGPSAALRAALAIPPSTQGDEDIGPATPSAAPAACLRQGSRSSQASTGSSGATTASTAPGGPASSSGGSFTGARPGPGVLQPPQGLGLEVAVGEGGAAAAGGASGGRHRSALYTSRTQHMLLSAKVRFAAPTEGGGELLQDPLPSAGAASSSSMGSLGSTASSYPAHAQQVAAAAVAAVQGMFGPGTSASPLPEPALLPVDSAGGSVESAGAQSCGAASTSSYIASSAGDRLAPVSSYGQASSCDSVQIQTPPPYVPALAGLRTPALASSGGLTRAASDGPVLLRVECVTFPGCVQLMLWGWCGGQSPLEEEEQGRGLAAKQQLALQLESEACTGGTITCAAAADVLVDAGCGRQDGYEMVVGNAGVCSITGSPAAAAAAAAAAVAAELSANVMVEVSMSSPGSGGWARVKDALLQLPGVVDVSGACSDPHTWYQGGSDASSPWGRGIAVGLSGPHCQRLPCLVPTNSGGSSTSSDSGSGSSTSTSGGSGSGSGHSDSTMSSQLLPYVTGETALVAVPAAGGSNQGDGGHTTAAGSSSSSAGGGRSGASALHIMIDRPSRGGGGSSGAGSDTPDEAPGDEEGDTPGWGRVGLLSGRLRGLQGASNWLFQLQRHSPLVLLAHPDSQTVQLHLLLRPAPPAPASNPYLSATPAGAGAGSSMVAVSGSASSAAAAEAGTALLPDLIHLVGRVGDVIVLLVKEGQVSSTWVWPEEQVLAALQHQLGDTSGDSSGDASQDAMPRQGSDQAFTPPTAPGMTARTGAVTPEGYQFALELQLPLLEEAGVYHLVLAHQLPPPPDAPMAGLASPNGSTLGQAPSVAFARLPLAVLPPGPYQEVYQLLLPAMWQEAVNEWHARRQQQREDAAAAAASSAAAGGPSSIPAAAAAAAGGPSSIPPAAAAAVVVANQDPGGTPTLEEHVQTVLWQHWCQLADDLGQVLQLGAALLPRWRLQQQAHLNDAELHLLQQLAPVVLSFFLGHGMDGCFFFTLGMLPPPLQQSWLLLHQRRSHAALLQQQLQLQQGQHQPQLLTAAPGRGLSSAEDDAAAAAGARDQASATEEGLPDAARPSLSLPILDLQGHRGVTSGTSSSYASAGASISSGGGAACSEPAAAFYDDSSMALTRMNTAAVAACEARTSLETSTPRPVSVACPERPGPLLSAPAQLTGAAERALLDSCPDAHGVFAAAGARLGLLLGLPNISGSFRGHGSPLQGLAMQDSTPSVAGVTTPCGADPKRQGLWNQESLRSLLSLRSNSSGIFSGTGLPGRSSLPSSSRWDEAAAADAAAAAGAAPSGLSGAPGGHPWLEMEEELDAGSEAAAAEQESAAAAAAAGEDGSSLQVTWSTPFSGFQAPGLEELYKLHKHATNLSADWGCAGFILLFMAALCLRLVWETDRWNTCGYILYLALKLVAYVPLLAGRTRFFISHREALVVALSQGLCCLLIANKVLAEEVLGVPPLFMPPEGPLTVFWKVRGELLIYGLMMPFQVHLRMKWNVVYVLAEAAVLSYMFAHLFPVTAVVVRFGGAAMLSLVLAWWWDLQLRRRFLEGRRAKVAGSCAAAACASSSGRGAHGSSLGGKQKAE